MCTKLLEASFKGEGTRIAWRRGRIPPGGAGFLQAAPGASRRRRTRRTGRLQYDSRPPFCSRPRADLSAHTPLTKASRLGLPVCFQSLSLRPLAAFTTSPFQPNLKPCFVHTMVHTCFVIDFIFLFSLLLLCARRPRFTFAVNATTFFIPKPISSAEQWSTHVGYAHIPKSGIIAACTETTCLRSQSESFCL